MYEMRCQSRFDARYWMLGASALGRPRGMVWGGRRLGFSTIKDIDDVISSVNTLNDDTRFYSLYEGKTIREAIEERGLIYVKNLVENGIIEIYGNVIDELLHENPQLYKPLKEAYNRAEY